MWPRRQAKRNQAVQCSETDSRGQSLQLGAVLLFGFLVLGLATAQAQLVPAEISQAELDHSQTVSDQLLSFTTAIFQTSVDGNPQSTTLSLGAEYTDRPWFVYPPPGSGTLSTTPSQELAIKNAEAVGEDAFDNYWHGETRQYSTRAISYEPTYRELDTAPTHRIEHGIPVASYDSETELQLTAGRQPVIDGNELSILTVGGELSRSGVGTEAVVAERVTSATTVEIEASGEPIMLRLPTTLPAETWDEILGDEPNVEEVTVSDGEVKLTLDSTERYELTVHRIDVGDGESQPEAAYLRNASETPVDARTTFNDRPANPVTVWAYEAGEYDTPEAEFTVPTDSQPSVGDAVCYTLVAGETEREKPTTVGVPSGSCE